MRKLRATHFLWDTSYEVIEASNCQIDILITVTDTFPFKPKLSFSRRTGANKYAFGFENEIKPEDVKLFARWVAIGGWSGRI